MGGNALSQPGVRLTAPRYFAVEKGLTANLDKTGLRYAVIPAYATKESFGDMDILFSNTGFNPLEVAKQLNATEVVRNGDVTSMGLVVAEGMFQVDLIKTTDEAFNFTLNYFSFNDVGNLIGRVGHKAGYKFGHKGLLYPLRDPTNTDHVIAELEVSTDWDRVLEFLGYDPVEYKKGFNTLEDIFKFTATSQYCNKEIYLLDNRNAKSRVRDSKRKTYMLFLEWLETSPEMSAFDWSDKDGLRKDFLQKAFEWFPDFKQSYDEVMEQHKINLMVAEKFNGEVVGKLTGLKGKDLGIVMQKFKEQFHSREVMNTWVLNASKAQLENLIMKVM